LGQENHLGGPVRSLVSGEHQCRNEAEWPATPAFVR
jgi:hypothetical protein